MASANSSQRRLSSPPALGDGQERQEALSSARSEGSSRRATSPAAINSEPSNQMGVPEGADASQATSAASATGGADNTASATEGAE